MEFERDIENIFWRASGIPLKNIDNALGNTSNKRQCCTINMHFKQQQFGTAETKGAGRALVLESTAC